MSSAATVLLGGLLLEAFLAGPFFLAHFNGAATSVADRHEILVDSNLDWGQDLRRLGDLLRRHRVGKIKLGYHGSADPRELGLAHEMLPGWNRYSRVDGDWPIARELVPGDLVAVSVNCRMGLGYPPMRRRYDALLEGQEPLGSVGHSILLFRIVDHRRIE
jgi:hypothetical protein